MLKRLFFAIAFLCSTVLLFSQDEARLDDLAGQAAPDEPLAQNIAANDESPLHYRKVMVIPYEPKLYMSEIDGDIAEKTGLSSHQIRARFRYGLATNVFVTADQNYKVVTMLSDDPEVAKDLRYIYMSIGYKYNLVPQEETAKKETAAEKLISKFKKTETSKEDSGGRIEQGQVKAVPEYRERYMGTRIINPAMLDYLSTKYEADLFIFLNQLDFKLAAGTDYRDLEADDYQRQMKVHYTIMDRTGRELHGGAAKYLFSSRTNDMNKIIKGMMPEVATMITAHLPRHSATPALEQKQKEEDKKARQQREELMKQY